MLLCSCSVPISKDRLAELMIEMYMFEQQIQNHPDLNRITDTALVYAAILHKHGYSMNDYQRSITHHLKKPDKLKKALIPYRDQIMYRKNALQQALDETNREPDPEEIKAEFRLFSPTRPSVPPFTLYVDSIVPWSIDSMLWWTIPDTTLIAPKEFKINIK